MLWHSSAFSKLILAYFNIELYFFSSRDCNISFSSLAVSNCNIPLSSKKSPIFGQPQYTGMQPVTKQSNILSA